MRYRIVVGVIIAAWCCSGRALAQSAEQVEIGAQVTALHVSDVDGTDVGIGGRIAWNVNDAVALEVVTDFFPTGQHDVARGGRKLHALVGPKIGWRAARAGVFAKIRAGIARAGEGRQQGACILIYPPPEACLVGEIRLAFDFGGVAEFYPSSRVVLRVDISDIVTRLRASSYRFAGRGDFMHGLNFAAGGGVRF